MRNHLILLSRRTKQFIVVFIDVAIAMIATWVAFSLRLDNFGFPEPYQWHIYLLVPFLFLPIFIRLGLYRAVFRYVGMAVMWTIMQALLLYAIVFFLILFAWAPVGIPRSIGVLQPLIFLLFIAGSRVSARFWLNGIARRRQKDPTVRLLIFGASAAGAQIAEAMLKLPRVMLVGFVDDDKQMSGKTINGQYVYAAEEIHQLIQSYSVTDVLLAMDKLDRQRRNSILTALRKYHVRVRAIPDMAAFAQGKITVSDIQELEISDLLGRDSVQPDTALIQGNIAGKVILVTGAGGSIGSELCRQILAARPSKLLLLEHSEYSLYSIHGELSARVEIGTLALEIVPLLGSVRDYVRLREICNAWRPDVIYHAAAYKHVPLVEHNPAEGVRNNILGTYNLARVAVEGGIPDFVLISTDKAVRPTNVMGASKRLAEMILQALTSTTEVPFLHAPTTSIPAVNSTKFAMVRFGNVLGSSGSVVPLFRQQIREGGPITLTDLEVTRYFMTISEAAELVIQAAAMAKGGDVFVLDMGEPVKIADLARKVVELSGLTVRDDQHPEGDIAIQVTGLRPGEKLYEELLIGENPERTAHPRIMKAHEDYLPWDQLQVALLRIFEAADNNDVATIHKTLKNLVSGYEYGEVVDWIKLAE
jgi:FlaA1/EpsC-like NDP-sugar epimerase